MTWEHISAPLQRVIEKMEREMKMADENIVMAEIAVEGRDDGFYWLTADERVLFAAEDQSEGWDQETGKPGVGLFSNAVQVWSVLNGRKSVADAAAAFNCSPQMVAAAVKQHYWMLLVGQSDDFAKVFIEHDGE